ncbi:electron transport complex subunit RsxC [Shewanella mesophila]|uniref:electron transport complex subunit RsxC n=1 Tax=Shewanella mesophila TaxID=2864208 RepID=UPI001C656E4D|nr:electron transport complex subunit RsxC [Shewanella mesophila]QYJ87764.1 electron transport complex subunit RsxC [Shewanella mesophila]
MLALFEQIDKGTLWQVPGGIHPPEFKTLSSQSPIARLPLADRFIVPIPDVGEHCTLNLNVGDTVDKGQPLTVGDSFRHLPVHAPVSGTLVAIEERPSNHASGLPVMCCVIQNDHQQRLASTVHNRLSRDDVRQMSSQAILARVQSAGIAGLGGAAFPTHIKLKPASDIELLIINGVECEPYITSDDLLMQQHSDEIIAGIEIIHQLLSPKRIIIAIEDNKPQAIEQMKHALNRSALPNKCARVTAIPTLYPSGGEKQLIQILTGQEVPSGSIPAHLGILVQNVGTVFSVEQAVYSNIPLIERVVTLTGNNIAKPGNYWVPIGTPIEHLLSCTQFKGDSHSPVIIGGPMMGYMLPNRDAPLLKGSNCVLAPSSEEIAPPSTEKPCIRCGECAIACPAQLLPQQLFWHAKAEEYDKAASYNLRDCIECGCCSYVCPSDIPLVEYYRIAKSALRVEAEDKKQAELAKQRFDSRMLRLEEEKRAREEKAKQAAQKRKAAMSGNDKDAIAAAMARIKAKKAAESLDATSVSEPQQDKVAAAIARAKAKKAAQQAEMAAGEIPTDKAAESATKDKVAAAIARAKAKKAAQQAATDDQLDNQTDSQADSSVSRAVNNAVNSTADVKAAASQPLTQQEKVAAAIARAKAKKAAKNSEVSSSKVTETDKQSFDETLPQTEATQTLSEADAKKAKIAAAVARAKAKKVATQDSTPAISASAEIPPTAELSTAVGSPVAQASTSDTELKKAKIAAAVAKAKAKKAANQVKSQDKTDDNARLTTDTPSDSDPSLSPEAIKQQRIAAAVAKAKAKKQAKAIEAAQQLEQKDS